jgi:hypothetical protein
MLRGSRPPALRGGGAVPHPVALLFALRTWSWWVAYLRTVSSVSQGHTESMGWEVFRIFPGLVS